MPPMKQRISFDRLLQETSSGISCHKCYKRYQYAPKCVLSLRQQKRVIQNYEKWTWAEKISVTATSKHRIRAIIGAADDEDKQYDSVNAGLSPYPRGADIATQFTFKGRSDICQEFSVLLRGKAMGKYKQTWRRIRKTSRGSAFY